MTGFESLDVLWLRDEANVSYSFLVQQELGRAAKVQNCITNN